MTIARVSTTNNVTSLSCMRYGRGMLLVPIRIAKYNGTINRCNPTALNKLLTLSGAPARSTITLATMTIAASKRGHFKMAFSAEFIRAVYLEFQGSNHGARLNLNNAN